MLRHMHAVVTTAAFVVITPLPINGQPTAPPVARTAAARRQTPTLPNRVFVDINGGFQSGTQTFSDTTDDALYGESASWDADYETRSGPAFDVGGGVRVWRNLIASVAYSRYRDTNLAAIEGEIPHPFFFNRNRAISGESAGLIQQEDVVHLSAMWAERAGRRLDVRVFGGPSLYRVQRDLVSDIAYAETYPYDTASFDSATVERVKVDTWGFHVGGDVTWMFTQMVGVGAMARFSRAETDLSSPANGDPISLRFGGLQFGGGLRFRLGRVAGRKEPTRRPRPTIPAAEPSNPPPGQPRATLEQPAVRTTALLKKDSPIFVRPGAVSPLRTLPAGTRVKVVEQVDEWLMVEFRDAQWGVRVGYVLRENSDW